MGRLLYALISLGPWTATAAGLSAVPVVAADDPGPSAVPLVALSDDVRVPLVLAEEGEDEPRRALLALDTSVGAPAGAVVGLALRPLPWLRAEGGGAYNGIGWGGQASATVGWLTAPFTPTLTVGGGLFATGDATALARDLGANLSSIPAARAFGYDYASAEAGLELGWPDRLTFRLRAGLGYVHATLHDTQATLRSWSGDAQLTASNLSLGAVVPSASLGCVVYLL